MRDSPVFVLGLAGYKRQTAGEIVVLSFPSTVSLAHFPLI